MKINEIIHLVLLFPLLWLFVFDVQRLNRRKLFLKYLSISIAILFFGITYDYYFTKGGKSLVYFSSQMNIMFLILYKLIRIPYFKIYKREPEISRSPEKKIDIIPTLIIISGMLILPFLIDSLIIQKLIK